MLSYIKRQETDYYRNLKVIIVSVRKDVQAILKAHRMKADGFLSKTCDIDELITAIESVLRSVPYFSDEVQEILSDTQLMRTEFTPNMLSPREKDVLKLLCESYTSKEIGDKLDISFNTVNVHRKNLLQKLGATNTSGLVKMAIELGLVGKIY